MLSVKYAGEGQIVNRIHWTSSEKASETFKKTTPEA